MIQSPCTSCPDESRCNPDKKGCVTFQLWLLSEWDKAAKSIKENTDPKE